MKADGAVERCSTGAASDGGGANGPSHATNLAHGIRLLGLEIPSQAQAKLLDFLALLVKWNAVYNLTSVRQPDDMLVVHLLDSLAILPLVDAVAPQSILDVGSGAGLPSIPLAITRPGSQVHSVDAVAKKIGFQLQAKATLSLANFHPVHHRVETLRAPMHPSIIVSRAFSEIPVMLSSIDHLADTATHVIAMKGAEPTDELASLPRTWRVNAIHPLDIPFLGARRCAVVLQRCP